ncbi:MAG: serine/threonine-protein kinase [Candidatus Melainabacteria bacterium]|nr:serine/threonine-protein kinase [Candidatus Melainabacteria bacterium]
MDKETKDSAPLFFGVMLNRSSLADAEARSKPVLLPYRVTWGLPLRKWYGDSESAKHRVFALLAVGYVLYLFTLISNNLYFPFAVLSLLIASALLFYVALVLPTDKMYLDRLSFIIPDSSLFSPGSKVLWSRIEEVSIVDTAESGAKSRFALRLSESSGEPHDLRLSAMDKETLRTLARYIQTYAPHARGLVQLQELERFYDYETGKLEGVSYTQLWESGSALRFGLTSFTPLLPGTMLQDAFKIEKQIAAGGFSAVYLACDQDGNRFVIKESVVPFNLDDELKNKAQEQFQREAKLLAKLNHPQIAQVFDHFQESGRSYLRMQYIEGRNLRDLIGSGQSVSEAIAIQWLQELAAILAYLHELSPPVVHRDLSPDNILVTADSHLVLIDFGAANEFIGAATGTLVGKHA